MWIEFKNKIPEDGQEILISDGKIWAAAVFCLESWNHRCEFGYGLPFEQHMVNGCDIDWDFDETRITHWQPAPELPKKEDV